MPTSARRLPQVSSYIGRGDVGIAPYEMCGASTRQKAMDLASRQGAAAQAYKMVPSKFDGCYGGIAAEIGAKNMPPACFLNAPTEGENKNLRFSPPVSLTLD